MSGNGHNGNTPAAWTGVIIAFVGFCVAAVAVVIAKPWLMWAAFGVVLLGPVVGKIMQRLGLGQPPTRSAPATPGSGPRAASGTAAAQATTE